MQSLLEFTQETWSLSRPIVMSVRCQRKRLRATVRRALIGWLFIRQMDLSVVGQNLMQPHHSEYGGDPGGLMGGSREASTHK